MSREAELPLKVGELPGLHPALGRALGEAGEGAPRIHELLERSVTVRCVGCGIVILPSELEALGLESAPGGASPRLDRLRLGYCARNGCDSRYFVASAGTGMVSWPAIFRRTRELLGGKAEVDPGGDEGPEAGHRASGREFRRQWRRLQLAAAGGVLLVVLLAWWWRSGARIPGISPKAREFIVAPSDTDAPGAGGSARPRGPSTNAPRNFQVR